MLLLGFVGDVWLKVKALGVALSSGRFSSVLVDALLDCQRMLDKFELAVYS